MITTENLGNPSVCIIGAGLAGLATAIKIKLKNPEAEILILEKKCQESNTQIAGMRLRAHKPGPGLQPIQELKELLAYTDDTEKIDTFSQLITQEIDFWQTLHLHPAFKDSDHEISPLQTEKQTGWFGPQWSGGHGLSVLNWFKEVANKLGIRFIKSEVLEIKKEGHRITSILAENQEDRLTGHTLEISAEKFVLAAGSAGGFLAASTNKNIRLGSAQLALEGKLPLTGLTNNMFHPFGRCKEDGTPLNGCFGTDGLAGAKIYLADGTLDEKTTKLLEDHLAHDNFGEIIQRFSSIEGAEPIVTIEYPNGKTCKARVSHHYCQLGLLTDDGVSVKETTNLFAVGDAEGWSLTNHRQRLPGFGLSKCLADAELVSQTIFKNNANAVEGNQQIKIEVKQPTDKQEIHHEIGLIYKQIKKCNTKYLLEIMGIDQTKENIKKIILKWFKELEKFDSELAGNHVIIELSMAMAAAHEQKFCKEGREPIIIDQEMIRDFKTEIKKEIDSLREDQRTSLES